jgi:hypothetical protein
MVATITFNGNLLDFGTQPRADLHPELRFIPSGPGADGNQLLFTATKVVTPAWDGSFSVPLAITENLTPDVFYRLNIRWLDAAGNFRGEDNPQWQLRVGVGATSFGDLVEASSPTFTIESATRPTGAYAYWLNTTTGDLYKWSGGDYVLVANLKGPAGGQGPQGLPGPGAELADTVIAAAVANPETGSYGAVLDVVSDAVGGLSLATTPQEVTILQGGNIGAARPTKTDGSAWPGPVSWFSAIGRPSNMRGDLKDKYFRISTDPLSFSPLNEEGLAAWYDPRKTGVANNAEVLSYPDQSANARTLAAWTASGATVRPLLDNTGMNGTPSIYYPSRSGLSINLTINAPPVVVVAANFRFDALPTSSTTQTMWSLGGSDSGKYSLQRAQAGNLLFSVDGLTAYNMTYDPGLTHHRAVCVITPSRVLVYIDGVVQLDQAVAFATLPSVSSIRQAWVSTGSTNTNWHAALNSRMGDMFIRTTATVPTTTTVSMYDNWLKARMGA